MNVSLEAFLPFDQPGIGPVAKAFKPSDITVETEYPCGPAKYGRSAVGRNAACCYCCGPARTF